MDKQTEEAYWTERYQDQLTAWDIGYPSTPIKEYIDQLENKHIRILIPGAGNAYEAEYIFQAGFSNIYVLDIAKPPLENLKKRLAAFPEEQLLHGDFFEHTLQYDLIIEQTFFCSFIPTPEKRKLYAKKMAELLSTGGKLVGLWFRHPLIWPEGKRPFGGSLEEYLAYFKPYFHIKVFDPAYNSIKPRLGNEYFAIMERKG